jgi:hypothetical protein
MNRGSISNRASNGRKIGSKMMVISVHSSGHLSRKITSWAIQKAEEAVKHA